MKRLAAFARTVDWFAVGSLALALAALALGVVAVWLPVFAPLAIVAGLVALVFVAISLRA